jgi:ketosteroid isomerase-like protein
MSSNLDLARSIYAAWEGGDYSRVEWAHPEIEWVMADGPSPGTWTGLTGMAAGLRELITPWDDYRAEAVEYRELDAERVLVPVRRSGRGKTSGVEIGHWRTKGASLFHIRDGKVTRLVIYFDFERALADLGRASEDDTS